MNRKNITEHVADEAGIERQAAVAAVGA